MFGRQPKETEKFKQSDLEDVIISRTATPKNPPEEIEIETELDLEKAQLVGTVEKISRIISPYFIVIVGWSLYEKNFLIGTILIIIGILSLLKVSARDVAVFFEWLKSFLGIGTP